LTFLFLSSQKKTSNSIINSNTVTEDQYDTAKTI